MNSQVEFTSGNHSVAQSPLPYVHRVPLCQPPRYHAGMKDELRRLPPPEDLRAEVEQAQKLGLTLFLLDRASAIGTDVMRANVPSPKELGIGAYLTLREGEDRPGDTWLVQFFTAGEPCQVLCRVRVPMAHDRKPTFEALEPPPSASEAAQLLLRARATALAALGSPAQPQNPVILPGAAIGQEGLLVYLLAGTTRSGVAVFGKHHRVMVSPDGKTVTKFEAMSKTFLEVPLDGGPPGSVGAGLFVTHIITECPVETHVLVSLMHRTPVYVGTARGNWVVDGDKMSLLEDAPERKPWWRFWQ
jgi:hypothetical protein